MELRRGDGEADGRRCADDVGGQRIDPGDVPRAGIHQHVVTRRKPSGAGNCSSWLTSSCSSGQRGLGIGSFAGADPNQPLHRVGLAVGGELGLLLGRVRSLTVEAASDIGFDLHLGALVGHLSHERAIEHRELGSPVLTTMASSVVAMTLPSKGFGSM